MKSMSFASLKFLVMSGPNRYPAPLRSTLSVSPSDSNGWTHLGDIPHPLMSSGSLHIKSHIAPSCGTSCFRSMVRIWPFPQTHADCSGVERDSVTWLMLWMAGDSPPCTQKTLLSITAAKLCNMELNCHRVVGAIDRTSGSRRCLCSIATR